MRLNVTVGRTGIPVPTAANLRNKTYRCMHPTFYPATKLLTLFFLASLGRHLTAVSIVGMSVS